MDNLTHSLVGAALGQAGLKRKTGLAMPALIIGANLPDVDAACFFWLEGIEHVGFRRGITHGPPAMVLLPLILAGLLWGFDRWQGQNRFLGRGKRPEGRLPVHFGWLFALSFIACLTHPALDWLNVYGVRLLEPFSSQWFYGDTLFIIDVWLWALLIGGVWWSLRREKRGEDWRKIGRGVVAAALAYIGLNGFVTDEIERSARIHVPDTRVAIAAPLPLWPFQRETIVQASNGRWLSSYGKGSRAAYPYNYISPRECAWPSAADLATGGSQSEAFLFWSRAPFAERAEDGSVVLRDARFYDPRARDRFAVALPEVSCQPPD